MSSKIFSGRVQRRFSSLPELRNFYQQFGPGILPCTFYMVFLNRPSVVWLCFTVLLLNLNECWQVNDTLPSGSAQPKGRSPTAVSSPMRKLPSLLDGDDGPAQVATTPVNINEALAARMQANRQKALERAKARRATNASV